MVVHDLQDAQNALIEGKIFHVTGYTKTFAFLNKHAVLPFLVGQYDHMIVFKDGLNGDWLDFSPPFFVDDITVEQLAWYQAHNYV